MPVNFWHGSQALYQEENYDFIPPPPIGSGVIWDAAHYRVVDLWLSYDKHGQLDIGWHVFLEPAEEEDDLPTRLFPDYYHQG